MIRCNLCQKEIKPTEKIELVFAGKLQSLKNAIKSLDTDRPAKSIEDINHTRCINQWL